MEPFLRAVTTAPLPASTSTTTTEYPEWVGWLTGGLGLVVLVVYGLVMLVAYIRIIQKAGYSGWWILVALVPVLNLVMFLVFAFSRWPVLRELDARRAGAPTWR